jgi:hypothetical protein
MEETIMKAFWKLVCVSCLFIAMPLVAGAEELFVNFKGPSEIEFGSSYTYSVTVQGKYDEVAWSASGGTVMREWWEDSRFFSEVQWHGSTSEERANVKVYGRKRGSKIVLSAQLFVAVLSQKRSLDFRSLQNAAGKCLDVHAKELTENGGPLQVWECNGSIQQLWKLDINTGHLVNKAGKCLDIHAPDVNTNGGRVQIWDCVTGPVPQQQQWDLTEAGALVNKGGKCLDIHAEEVQKDGGKVQIWDCVEGAVQQQWRWID